MPYAPARARFRAPWIAFLLIPLLALASVLVPAAAATAADGPQLAVAATAATEAGGLTVSVSGTGFAGIAAAYLSVIEKDSDTALVGSSVEQAMVDDAFSDVALTVPASSLDRGKQYEVIAWKTRSIPGSGNTYVRAGLVVTDAQWDAIFPPSPTVVASVVSADLVSGLVVNAAGSDFTGLVTVRGAVAEKGTQSLVTAAATWMIPSGSFSKNLTVPTASLDPDTQYEIIVWPNGEDPSSANLYARADIVLSDAQRAALFTPSYGITVDQTNIADGTVSVSGVFPATITSTVGATAGTQLTTGLYLMYCDEPTGTVGTAGGRLTGSACDATKQLSLASGPGTQGGTVTGTVTGGIWTFTTTLTVTERTGASGIFTRLYHGFNAGNVTNPYLYDQFVPVTFADPAPTGPQITATVSDASADDGLEVTVTGTGFAGISGAYGALIERGTESSVGMSGGYAAFGYWMPPAGGFDGDTFQRTLVAPVDNLEKTKEYEVLVWRGHSAPDATTIYDRVDITISEAQWQALLSSTEPEPEPETPGTTPPVTAGSLSWGVKSSFRSYVTGSIAHGAITTNGVTTVLGNFVFPQSGDAQLVNGVGSVAYSGSVRFTGHDGTLDLRLSDPQVRIDSATSGTLLVRVNGGTRVAFASLALASGTVTTDATGAIRYGNVPATLTSAGATGFEGFYGAGTALDPVSFVVGSASSPSAGTIVVASASARSGNTPAATPPATDGITVTDGELVEGGEITAEADGFQPNESGILVVVYSEPTVLAENLTADAAGHVSWTGTLPRGLTGEHTLTFQGSVDRGVVLDIAAASELACTVSDATLVWGFKETFRAYIDGSIANGEWTTEGGVSYATPVFTWAGGTGGADDEGSLDARFSGAVRFTGHGGVLDTTIADPRVVIDGDRAVLLLDIHGTTQAGEAVEQLGVEFAELDLDGATRTQEGDTLTLTDVPAVLTAAGSAAFGTYPEGEALDPLTITATVESGCATEVETPTAAPAQDELETEQAADGGWPAWATVLLIALLAAAIVATVVIVLVRRRRA